MDLTFQVPMQYCPLQHWTLLPSPITSTTGCCFPFTSTTGCCFSFGSVSSFFLELFLHFSPLAFWAPTDLQSFLSMSYLFAFSTVSALISASQKLALMCHFLDCGLLVTSWSLPLTQQYGIRHKANFTAAYAAA